MKVERHGNFDFIHLGIGSAVVRSIPYTWAIEHHARKAEDIDSAWAFLVSKCVLDHEFKPIYSQAAALDIVTSDTPEAEKLIDGVLSMMRHSNLKKRAARTDSTTGLPLPSDEP